MPRNQFFKFKQFTIWQDQTAMKVCTDACILGAFVEVKNTKRILDIGAGTGLLSLMAAQRSEAQIEAVEIDESAYNQAVKNVSESIFKDKIKVINKNIVDFESDKFDLIVSNPPFYQNSLQSPDGQVNKALHSTELSFEKLTQSVNRLLDDEGRFVVLLPSFETNEFIKVAQKNNLFLHHQLTIRHDQSKPIFRVISTFKKTQVLDYQVDSLVIWQENAKVYSDEFKALLKEYYLIF